MDYFTCSAYLVLYFSCMLHACYLLFILCLCMSAKSSTEVMLYVVLTMPTLNKAYLFIYLLKLQSVKFSITISTTHVFG